MLLPMSMTVRFWGTRGSIPTPGAETRTYGGNTPCVSLHHDDAVLICDAGTGIRPAGLALQEEAPERDLHLLLSHTHWDHIQGFPFFQPLFDARVRLRLWGADQAGTRMRDLLSRQMSHEYFPVAFEQLAASIEPHDLGAEPREIGGVVVRHHPQPHPGGSSAFRFEAGGRAVVYLTDSELDSLLADPGLPLRDPDAHRELPSSLVDFVRGADLLIGDGQYTDAAYPSHQGWGHPRATTTLDLAAEAEVSRLAVFHHDPTESDQLLEEKIEAVRRRAEGRGVTLEVHAAREGQEIALS